MTSLSPLISESQEILENEINIWISQIEAFYPEIPKRIAFKKPDYNESIYYTYKYELEAGKIMVEDLAEGLIKDFKLEHKFLIHISKSKFSQKNRY